MELSVWDDDSDQLVLGRDPDLIASETVNVDSRQGNSTKPMTVMSSYAIMTLRWKVVCNENFYGDCTVYCKAEDSDATGHYACDEAGKKVCMAGWTGESCRISETFTVSLMDQHFFISCLCQMCLFVVHNHVKMVGGVPQLKEDSVVLVQLAFWELGVNTVSTVLILIDC